MENGPIIAGIILALFSLIFPCCIEGAIWRDGKQEYLMLSPATLKRNTKMNWVGCTLTWLALGIVSPLMFIYKCIYNLFHI